MFLSLGDCSMSQSLVQGQTGQLRPFLPANANQRRRARRASVCSSISETAQPSINDSDRRAMLLGLFSLGFAANAEAKTAAPVKKDAYQVWIRPSDHLPHFASFTAEGFLLYCVRLKNCNCT